MPLRFGTCALDVVEYYINKYFISNLTPDVTELRVHNIKL